MKLGTTGSTVCWVTTNQRKHGSMKGFALYAERQFVERSVSFRPIASQTYGLYMRWTILGYEEPGLIHSDHFREDRSYREAVYSKGASVLRMLEYVVGDSTFARLMRTYSDRWRFRDPTSNDFEAVAEEVSGMELDWFFDQWLRSTRTCDYSIRGLTNEKSESLAGDGTYRVTIGLENKDLIHMAIDQVLTLEDESTRKLIIPVGWIPKNESNAKVLPRWDWVDRSYLATVQLKQKAVYAEIDPSLRLADLNRPNNSSRVLGKPKVYWVKRRSRYRPIDQYAISVRPSVWFSERDGFRVGALEFGSAFANR
ncbi:MAG: M1 family aminopeptidase, partial [Bacteroidota bacterium]